MRRSLDEAIKRRDDLEAEADAITSELELHGGVKAPLVDSEGFPRADIDVYRARHLRHRLACIQTDHKAVMKKIEELLPLVLAPQETKEAKEAKEAFAKVADVREGSPAHRAGFRVGDRLIEYGDARNLDGLKAWTLAHLNTSFPVVVDRDGAQLSLDLTPQPWQGDGVVGCHFVPL